MITLPNTITPGTEADADEVQENFDELALKALDKTGDTMTGTLVSRDVRPSTDAARDLGSASFQFRNLYLSGSVIGPAGVNAFGTVAVSGQSDVVADAASDTLTLVAGTGITITTTAGSDTITLTANPSLDAGGSNVDYKAGGNLYTGITAVGNVGTGEDTLYSQAVAANVLSTDGDRLEIMVVGTSAANSNSKTIKVKFGSTTLATNTWADSAVRHWSYTFVVVRISATSQIAFRKDGGTLTGSVTLSTPGETCSNAITVAVTGEATATDDLILKSAHIDYFPKAN